MLGGEEQPVLLGISGALLAQLDNWSPLVGPVLGPPWEPMACLPPLTLVDACALRKPNIPITEMSHPKP